MPGTIKWDPAEVEAALKRVEKQLALAQPFLEAAAQEAGKAHKDHRAKNLPEVPPVTDLWPQIAAGIGAPSGRTVPAPQRQRPTLWGLRFTFSLPQLAAASVAVIAISASLAWWSARTDTGLPRLAALTGATRSESVVTASNRAYIEFAREVSALKRILTDKGDRLDPETVRVIEKNLKIIEEAIQESRNALESDPSNAEVQSHLVATMGGKVKLLRRATDIALAQAQGT